MNMHHRWGNFRSPRRFTEKIQWRILNDRRDLITLACDKQRSKEYVSAGWKTPGVSENFKIPTTYWFGSSIEDFKRVVPSLPPRYVIKPNHSSGRFLVVDSQEQPVTMELISELFQVWLRADEETESLGHWGYQNARRAIVVEERVGIGSDTPIDIRVFTNRGEIVGAACTGIKPNGEMWSATYDGELNRRPSGHPGQLPLDAVTPLTDLSSQTIKELRFAVRTASGEFDQVRVDFYRVKDKFYFGEFTAYSSGGLVEYNDETDYRLGTTWELPNTRELVGSDPR